MRCGGMPSFQLLYFDESMLEQAAEVEARDALEAVKQAAGRPSHLRAEIWSENRKVAVIGSSRIEWRPARRREPDFTAALVSNPAPADG
jgi:hypothetical protein